jgi:protein SCO1/2
VESQTPREPPVALVDRRIGVLRVVRLVSLIIALCAAGLIIYRLKSAPAETGSANLPDELPEHGTTIEPPKPLSNFTLTSQDGKPLSLSDLHGKYVLLFFGYTHCPDVCPTTLSDFLQVKRQIGAASSEVRFVFVSVDGERDTPPVLARFVKNFDASFIGLQGDDATLGRIGPEYGLYYKKEKAAGSSQPYSVTHSSSTYLLDRAGRMRMIYSFGIAPQVIATDIGTLLASD